MGAINRDLERAIRKAAAEIRTSFGAELADRAVADWAARLFSAGLRPRMRPGCKLSAAVRVAIEMLRGSSKWREVYPVVFPGFRSFDKYERQVRCASLRRNVRRALKRRSGWKKRGES